MVGLVGGLPLTGIWFWFVWGGWNKSIIVLRSRELFNFAKVRHDIEQHAHGVGICNVFQQERQHYELCLVGICIAQQSSLRQHCRKVVAFRISNHKCHVYGTLQGSFASFPILFPILSAFLGLNFLFALTMSLSLITNVSKTRAPIAPAPHTFRSYFERTTQSKIWMIWQWGGEASYNP